MLPPTFGVLVNGGILNGTCSMLGMGPAFPYPHPVGGYAPAQTKVGCGEFEVSGVYDKSTGWPLLQTK